VGLHVTGIKSGPYSKLSDGTLFVRFPKYCIADILGTFLFSVPGGRKALCSKDTTKKEEIRKFHFQ
jgi:hypothetical protein